MMHTSRFLEGRRRGLGLVEALFALGLLSAMVVPLVTLLTRTGADSHGADRRLVLELRARRHQAEVVTTTFDTVMGTVGEPFPIALIGPAAHEGYGEFVDGIEEETRVVEIADGLMEVRTDISWQEGEHLRSVRVRRLMLRPTLALESRSPLTPAEI